MFYPPGQQLLSCVGCLGEAACVCCCLRGAGTRCRGPPPAPRGAPRRDAWLRLCASVAGAAGPELAGKAASPVRAGVGWRCRGSSTPRCPCCWNGADAQMWSAKRVFSVFSTCGLWELLVSSFSRRTRMCMLVTLPCSFRLLSPKYLTALARD